MNIILAKSISISYPRGRGGSSLSYSMCRPQREMTRTIAEDLHKHFEEILDRHMKTDRQINTDVCNASISVIFSNLHRHLFGEEHKHAPAAGSRRLTGILLSG